MASTIEDVARAAGVATSTVPYVLSGKRPISPPTQERVHRAIRELGYRPHAGARALASNRADVIALMAPLRVDVDVAVIMQLVAGVVTAARTFDHDVLLLTADEITGIERVASGSMVDALVVMDVEADDPRLPVLRRLHQPAVLIGLPRDPAGLACVDLDFAAAGELAVQHLSALGHRRVALVGSPRAVYERGTSYAERMRAGLTRAASEHGIQAVVEPCEPSTAGATDAIDRVLARLPDVTSLVVHNEIALPGVLATLRERGRRVPDDLSVLAVCPPDVAVNQRTAVTSIDLPAHTLGEVAVAMAMARVQDSAPPETRLLAPRLVARTATGPASG